MKFIQPKPDEFVYFFSSLDPKTILLRRQVVSHVLDESTGKMDILVWTGSGADLVSRVSERLATECALTPRDCIQIRRVIEL